MKSSKQMSKPNKSNNNPDTSTIKMNEIKAKHYPRYDHNNVKSDNDKSNDKDNNENNYDKLKSLTLNKIMHTFEVDLRYEVLLQPL